MALTDVLGSIFNGLIADNAPKMMKGMLNTWLKENKITIEILSDYIMRDESLWHLVPQEKYLMIRNMKSQLGNLNWLTSDWLIQAVRDEHPVIASLFLGWEDALIWLDKNLDEVKKGVETI